VLQIQVLKHGLNNHIGLLELLPPLGTIVRQAHHAAGSAIISILGHTLLLDLALEVVTDVLLPAADTGQVLVLEEDAVPREGGREGGREGREKKSEFTCY